MEEQRESTEVVSNTEPTARDVTPVDSEKSVKHKSDRTALSSNLKASSEDVKTKIEKASEAPVKPSPIPQQLNSVQERSQATMIAPPADMNAAEKQAFSKLTPEMQQYLSRRSYEQRADYSRKTMEASAKEKELSDIYSVVTPALRDEYARQGIAVPDLVRRAVAWDKAFKTDRLGTAMEYLEAYGIHPSELLDGQHQNGYQQESPEYLTREEAEALADERIAKQFEQMQQSSIVENNYNVVQGFIQSKPLFKDIGTAAQLEAEMAPIVVGLRQSNPSAPVQEILETAYNYVTKGHPTFSALASQQSARSDSERLHAEAQKAKEASRSISGGPGTGSPKVKIKDSRESLRYHLSK